MVVGPIVAGIKIAQKIYKYRNQIYSVVTAQDRAIKGAFVGTRISKAAQYGWRTGAGAGGLIGSYITNDAEDSPGNGIQKKIPKQSTTGPSNKTRNRFAKRDYSRYSRKCRPNQYSRRSSYN